MELSKSKLKQLIKEELRKVLQEQKDITQAIAIAKQILSKLQPRSPLATALNNITAVLPHYEKNPQDVLKIAFEHYDKAIAGVKDNKVINALRPLAAELEKLKE